RRHPRRRHGKGQIPEQVVEPSPAPPLPPPTPRQPLPPHPEHLVTKPLQATQVTNHPEIAEVTAELIPQCLVLRADRPMTVQPAPVGDLLERPTEPAAGRLPLHHPAPSLGPTPQVREPQEVERPRLRYVPGARRRGAPLGPPKRHQPRLVGA